MAKVENDCIRLPEGIHLEDGYIVCLEIPLLDQGKAMALGWPHDYFDRTCGVLVGERMERPDQNVVEEREDW